MTLMGTDEAKVIYKERAATAECANAQARCRHAFYQFVVRGMEKLVRSQALRATDAGLSTTVVIINHLTDQVNLFVNRDAVCAEEDGVGRRLEGGGLPLAID